MKHTALESGCLGGGYKKRNVARCWTYETAVLCGQRDAITDQLPANMYLDNFKNEKDDYTRVPSQNADRMNIDRRGTITDGLNKPAHLEKIRINALEHLRHLEAAPGTIFCLLMKFTCYRWGPLSSAEHDSWYKHEAMQALYSCCVICLSLPCASTGFAWTCYQ